MKCTDLDLLSSHGAYHAPTPFNGIYGSGVFSIDRDVGIKAMQLRLSLRALT
jgi:hypothetical protein